MSITAVSSSNYAVQPNPDNNQNIRLTVTENGDSKTLELGYGTDFQVLAVVKATESDFSPYNSSTTYPSSMGMGGTQQYYWVAYRYKNSTSDTQSQFRLKSFDANALTGSSNWGREYYDIQPSKVEPFFGVDLNNDNLTDGTVTKTAVATDTAGVRLKIDADGLHHLTDGGVDYAIAPRMSGSTYKFNYSSGTYSREAVAVEKVASSNGSSEPEYLLVVKSVNQGGSGSSGSSSSSTPQTSWEVYTLRTQQGWTDFYSSASSNTTGTAGTSGSGYYTPPGSTAAPGNTNAQPSVPTLYFDYEAARPSTISGY